MYMSDYTGYMFCSLGVAGILSMSAFGACDGMSSCGSASILHSHIPIVITYSYISMIMVSTIFFYGFILSIVIMNRVSSDYDLISGIHHFLASLLFGVISLYAGKSMGSISNNGFKVIAKKPEFYTSFIICLASVEVTLVIGFLCSLLVVYKIK